MPLPVLEPDRAVEIISPKYGSGYRIGGRLILTARHIVLGMGQACRVRAKRAFGEADAAVVWIAPKTDVALIVLPESFDKDAPVFFGFLPSMPVANRLEFHLYGWPKWARTYDGEQAMAGGCVIPGKIHLGDYSPDNLLVLEPERLPDAPSDNYESQWEGISGAAVLCNGLVVAVQHRHQNTNRRASLEATPLSKVYDDPDWQRPFGKVACGVGA
jgi:hypothetical protein